MGNGTVKQGSSMVPGGEARARSSTASRTRYLLVSHIPIGHRPGATTIRIGDMWLEDLRVQAAALSEQAFEVVLAAPAVPRLEQEGSGGVTLVDVTPADEGFAYVPLPYAISLGRYARSRGATRAALRSAMQGGGVVQASTGGYPVPVGLTAWEEAGRAGATRVWVIDGADPFSRFDAQISAQRNPVKRAVLRGLFASLSRRMVRAIDEADAVFVHNDSARKRLEGHWHERCHLFERSLVHAEQIIGRQQVERRRARMLDRARPLMLVAAGRQTSIKATDHVIQAVALARAQGSTAELDVFGEGDALDDYRALAAKLGVEGAVRFRGTVPYGPAFFDAIDACQAIVITNLTAEISRNVAMGMARGLPLVIYRNEGSDAMVERSGAGVLVPTGDVAALARVIGELDADRGRLVTMMERGIADAPQRTLAGCHRQRAALVRRAVDAPGPGATGGR